MKKTKHADKYIFYFCLGIAVALFVFGALCPPIGIIDNSILKAGGILLGFAALGVAGQNLANGKDVVFSHGETEVTIKDDDDEDSNR